MWKRAYGPNSIIMVSMVSSEFGKYGKFGKYSIVRLVSIVEYGIRSLNMTLAGFGGGDISPTPQIPAPAIRYKI